MSSGKASCGESAPPSWIKDGELVPEKLKAVVSALAKRLASSSLDVQREGATSFLSLINTVWTLETHVARDSADLIANEMRYVAVDGVTTYKFVYNISFLIIPRPQDYWWT